MVFSTKSDKYSPFSRTSGLHSREITSQRYRHQPAAARRNGILIKSRLVCVWKRSDAPEDVCFPHMKRSAPPPAALFNSDQDDHISNGTITTRRQRARKGRRPSGGRNGSTTAHRPSSPVLRSQMCHRPPSCRVNATLNWEGKLTGGKTDEQPGNGSVTNVRFTTKMFHRHGSCGKGWSSLNKPSDKSVTAEP